MTGRSGSSQAWAWTRAARFNLISDKKQRASGTPPRPTSTPHNIIRSSAEGMAGEGGGGRSTAAVRGEICFHFSPTFGGIEDQTNAVVFPSLLLTRLNLSAPVSYPRTHTQEVPLRVCSITTQRLLHDTTAAKARDQTPHSGLHVAERDTEDGATGANQNTFRQELRLELWCHFQVFCTRWSVINAPLYTVIESIILYF